nr:protease inhibitor I42 family protein [Wenzhouxiangella sp. XN24]
METLMRRVRLPAVLSAVLLAGCGQRAEPPATIPPPIEPPAAAEQNAPDADEKDTPPAAGQPAAAADASPITVTDEDDGRSLRLQTGEAVIVKLPADRAGGMTWIPAGNALPVVATDGLPGFEPDTGAGGAGPGLETWRFIAAEPGQAELAFEYRDLQGGGPPLKTVVYRFEVE